MITTTVQKESIMKKSSCNLTGSSSGFTLIEMMIVLVIVGVVLVLVPPGMAQLSLSTNLKSYSHQMLKSVFLARSEAIKRNSSVTLCVSTDGTSCAGAGDWEEGWIVLAADGTVIKSHQSILPGYRMTGDAAAPGSHTMVFQSTGAASTSSNIKVCRQQPEVGNQEREVRVTATGKGRVTRTESGTCA
jgi:type IV fimbrial biogenesis protein FimT